MDIIKQDGEYTIIKVDDYYSVLKGKDALRTPSGTIAITRYLPIAERLMNDWEVLGYDSYMCPWSILSYHFTMVDNFSKMPKALILRMLNSLNWEKGWTLRGCPSPNPHVYMEWIDYFGQNPARTELIREWLQNQTIMQLVASTCVYNEFMDYNIAFFMAIVVEELPEKEHKKTIKRFYEFISKFNQEYTFDEVWDSFGCFRLYYGIHYKEDGKHLPNPITSNDQQKSKESE